MTVGADLTREPVARRATRARCLAREREACAELLTFYASLAEFQESLLRERTSVVRAMDSAEIPFASALNGTAASALIDEVLRWLSLQSQPGLAHAARALSARDNARWQPSLESCWQRGGAVDADVDDIEQFVLEALLQPFAESVASTVIAPNTLHQRTDADAAKEPLTCPTCSGLPVVATLREQAHGARRSLVCGFCLTEWPMPRIVCPACGEHDFDALFVYRAEEFPAVRLDACDSCDTYIKTIDLTADGAAIHIVDDLATLPTDLWAAGNGYRKLRPNLLRL